MRATLFDARMEHNSRTILCEDLFDLCMFEPPVMYSIRSALVFHFEMIFFVTRSELVCWRMKLKCVFDWFGSHMYIYGRAQKLYWLQTVDLFNIFWCTIQIGRLRCESNEITFGKEMFTFKKFSASKWWKRLLALTCQIHIDFIDYLNLNLISSNPTDSVAACDEW